MTPDELRKLADEATPGQWKITRRGMEEYHGSVEVCGDTYVCLSDEEADARLIALAPDLARLCAELGEALSETLDAAEWASNYPAGTYGYPEIAESIGKGNTALVKLSELNNGAEHPPGAERT